MTTNVSLSPAPILQFFNNQQQFNAGGSILTQVGGVNYPTYEDSAGATPLPNPIPLNSRGEISNASGQTRQLFLASGVVYTFTIYDANNNQIDQASYVTAGGTTFSSAATVRAAATAASPLFVSGSDGGWFYRVSTDTTTPEDGGSFCGITLHTQDYATAGVFKRSYSGAISATWYMNYVAGSDAAPTLQVWLNALAAYATLTEGTTHIVNLAPRIVGDLQGLQYTLKSSITWPVATGGVTFQNGTLIADASFTPGNYLFTLTSNGSDHAKTCNDLIFSNLWFRCNGLSGGLYCVDYLQLEVKGCTFIGFPTGSRGLYATGANSHQLNAHDNEFYGKYYDDAGSISSYGECMYIDCSDSNLHDNVCGYSPVALYISASASAVQVNNNHFYCTSNLEMYGSKYWSCNNYYDNGPVNLHQSFELASFVGDTITTTNQALAGLMNLLPGSAGQTLTGLEVVGCRFMVLNTGSVSDLAIRVDTGSGNYTTLSNVHIDASKNTFQGVLPCGTKITKYHTDSSSSTTAVIDFSAFDVFKGYLTPDVYISDLNTGANIICTNRFGNNADKKAFLLNGNPNLNGTVYMTISWEGAGSSLGSTAGTSIRTAAFQWNLSGSGTSNYYCQTAAGGNPSLPSPNAVLYLFSASGSGTYVQLTHGTLGALSAGQWAYGDTDTLGYSTIYVRLADSTDPDTKALNYVTYL